MSDAFPAFEGVIQAGVADKNKKHARHQTLVTKRFIEQELERCFDNKRTFKPYFEIFFFHEKE